MADLTATLRGLTWGHRRAIKPLAQTLPGFASIHPNVRVEWSVRSLQQFEHQPIEVLAQQFDFIVLDHPFTPRLAASGKFQPVDDVLNAVHGGLDPASYVGPSLASYQMDGCTWAVPVDGATMHAVYRADVLGDSALPVTWSDVLALGESSRRAGKSLAMALSGHHGLLALGSLMANLGYPWRVAAGTGGIRLDRFALAEALRLLEAAAALAPAQCREWNAIDLHEQMQQRNDLPYCPLVYGYATYAEDLQAPPLSFAPFPGPAAPHAAGTVLGGAGVGWSASCGHSEAARAYLSYLAQASTQQLFMEQSGQPARVEPWNSKPEQATSGLQGFCSAVRGTMEQAVLRPRSRGYSEWEQDAGRLLASRLRQDIGLPTCVDRMLQLAEAYANNTVTSTL